MEQFENFAKNYVKCVHSRRRQKQSEKANFSSKQEWRFPPFKTQDKS